jgi:hypothetical protein
VFGGVRTLDYGLLDILDIVCRRLRLPAQGTTPDVGTTVLPAGLNSFFARVAVYSCVASKQILAQGDSWRVH